MNEVWLLDAFRLSVRLALGRRVRQQFLKVLNNIDTHLSVHVSHRWIDGGFAQARHAVHFLKEAWIRLHMQCFRPSTTCPSLPSLRFHL